MRSSSVIALERVLWADAVYGEGAGGVHYYATPRGRGVLLVMHGRSLKTHRGGGGGGSYRLLRGMRAADEAGVGVCAGGGHYYAWP